MNTKGKRVAEGNWEIVTDPYILLMKKVEKKKKNTESVPYSVVSDCDPMDCSPTGYSVHGISQAVILGWVLIPFSRGSS